MGASESTGGATTNAESATVLEIEVPLSEELRARLQTGLPKGSDVGRLAGLVARAGAMELLGQAAGIAVFSSISDLRSFRIRSMLEAGMTLSEAEATVAAVFGVESKRAKSLVSAAVARYRVELRVSVEEEIRALLNEATWDKEDEMWIMRLPSMFVRDRVADELEQLDVPDPVSAKRGARWKMADETYQSLRVVFDLSEDPPPTHEGA